MREVIVYVSLTPLYHLTETLLSSVSFVTKEAGVFILTISW
jgi:hypothetical protein